MSYECDLLHLLSPTSRRLKVLQQSFLCLLCLVRLLLSKCVLHHLGQAQCLLLAAYLTSCTGALICLLAKHATLCAAHSLAAILVDETIVTCADCSVGRIELAVTMAGADGTIFSCRTLLCTFAPNETHITLADANLSVACCFDEALTIATANFALEHWALDMASGANVWLLAVAACLVGEGILVCDTLATIITTTCQVAVGIHGAAVLAILSHVSLLAGAFGGPGLEIEFTIAIVGARNTILGTRASKHARIATVPILAGAFCLATLLVQLAEAVATAHRALLVPGALFGAVVTTPAIHAHALCLLILEHARPMAAADGPFGITRAFFFAGEALEARTASALSTLRLLHSRVCVFDEACTVPRAVCAGGFAAAWALELASIAHESSVAVAHRLKLVVHCTLAVTRAKVLILVARAQEVALPAEETRLAFAFGGAIISHRAVTLA